MTPLVQSTSCCNCGQIHHSLPGRHSSTCIFIGARTHGSGSDEQLVAERLNSQAFTTIPIPVSEAEQEALFNQVWTWFVDIKEENDENRTRLTRTDGRKGALKVEAPMIWLRWRSPDGRRGQTRNENNYSALWRKLVTVHTSDAANPRLVAWLTLSPLSLGETQREMTGSANQRHAWSSRNVARTVQCP